MSRKKAKPLAQHHADRRRYDKIIDRYLRDCYALRTVARVSELADLLDAPRPYLSKVILELFGKPLRAVLRERQLAEAVRLLKVAPDLDLDEIAAASAFGHRSTLFRLSGQLMAFPRTNYALALHANEVTNCDFTRCAVRSIVSRHSGKIEMAQFSHDRVEFAHALSQLGEFTIRERIADRLADAMFDIDDVLGMLSETEVRQVQWIEPEVRSLLNRLDDLMKRFCD